MADYSPTHGRALATMARKGTAVTFSLASPGTYNAATDTYSTPSTTTVAGYAVRVPGDPVRYRELGLVQGERATLLFAPNTFASQPSLGSTVTWDSAVYTVRDVDPVEPDGSAIVCEVIVAR